jgi:hypothetical protein
MFTRGYRLPPVVGPSIDGVEREKILKLVEMEGMEGTARLLDGAPVDLRSPHPFAELIEWARHAHDRRPHQPEEPTAFPSGREAGDLSVGNDGGASDAQRSSSIAG